MTSLEIWLGKEAQGLNVGHLHTFPLKKNHMLESLLGRPKVIILILFTKIDCA